MQMVMLNWFPLFSEFYPEMVRALFLKPLCAYDFPGESGPI